MIIKEHVLWAIDSITHNKLRSTLSMLWIIIWVFSIIVMLAIWQWTSSQIIDRFNNMGANLISISPWWSNSSNVRNTWWWSSSPSTLMTDDLLNFIKEIPWVKNISPSVSTSKQLIYWSYNSNVQIIWVNPIYKELKNLTITNGNFISEEDVNKSTANIILWYEVAQNTFWNEDPIWKEIKLWNKLFIVIWVLGDSSQTNRRAVVPITTAMQKLVWTHYYSALDIEIDNVSELEFMKSFIKQELNRYLNIKSENDEPYTISNLTEIVSQIEQVTGTFTMFLAWIAAISLIVWWIWVMNIMLVSVIERTKEIWIRKALWATGNDILSQFLIESLIISLVAWFLWILLSFGIVAIINKFMTAIITTNSVFIAFCSVVFIWIVFWILPASKASKLKPIDALRFE